jgi:drug/metabolite transporter (DMT)-like permease
MQKIWLSPRLYQLLPVAYILSGFLLLTNFGDDPLGLISGSMLCVAAILIWALRIHAASKATARKQEER